MSGLTPKEENMIVRISKEGMIRKKIRNWINNNSVLKIPLFQRRYLWTTDQLKKLLDDAWTINRSKSKSHDLGTVMVQINNENQYVVIDGQQRLTTLSILFSILHKKGIDMTLHLIDLNGNPILIPTIHDQEPQFQLINAVFEKSHNNQNYIDNDQSSNIITVASQFDNFLTNQTLIELEQLAENLLDQFGILEITIPDDAENLQVVQERIAIRSVALQTFMQNGSPGILNGSLDLTRNLILSQIPFESQVELQNDQWMKIEQQVAKQDPVQSYQAEKRFIARIFNQLKSIDQKILKTELQDNKLGMQCAFKRQVVQQIKIESNLVPTIVKIMKNLLNQEHNKFNFSNMKNNNLNSNRNVFKTNFEKINNENIVESSDD